MSGDGIRGDATRTQVRELLWIAVPAVLFTAFAFWLAYQFVEPAPPRRITISTGGPAGAYQAFGTRYAEILARSGITLETRTSKGSIENIARLREPSEAVQLALVQGGIANEKTAPGLVSLGRVFLEPLWVFYRLPEPVERLTSLAGRRIAIGPEGSGNRALAETLLTANNIDAAKATLLPLAGQAAADALLAGEVDAVFLTLAPQAQLVQKLLAAPGLRLMSFAQAAAYSRVFPFLSHVVLPMGALDLVANRPEIDVHLVAPMAAVVARDDLHPALIGLLVQAIQDVHRQGGMFQKAGEFPRPYDPEFPLAEDAERIYKQGPPFFQRLLPFWLATFIERMAVMVLPIATVLIPLFKLVPLGYDWKVRGRIFYWYGQLKTIEQRVDVADGATLTASLDELGRIEQAVSAIPVPIFYSVDYYDLRSAIDLVRQRLEERAQRLLASTAAPAFGRVVGADTAR